MLKDAQMKKLSLGFVSLVVAISTLLANGGAWQTGVPGTGSASASNQNRKTNVTIEDERLKIDLHPEYAEVEVHYRMHNTGPKVDRISFFRSSAGETIRTQIPTRKETRYHHYQITVDGKN